MKIEHHPCKKHFEEHDDYVEIGIVKYPDYLESGLFGLTELFTVANRSRQVPPMSSMSTALHFERRFGNLCQNTACEGKGRHHGRRVEPAINLIDLQRCAIKPFKPRQAVSRVF